MARISGALAVAALVAANVYISHRSGVASAAEERVRQSRRFYSLNPLIAAAAFLQIAIIDLTNETGASVIMFAVQASALAVMLLNALLILQPNGRRMVGLLESEGKGLSGESPELRRYWEIRWVSFGVHALAALAAAFSFLL